MPAPDLRTRGEWGIEDCSNPRVCVAGIVIGNSRKATSEAFKLCKHTNAPVIVYTIDGGEWTEHARVMPD